MNQILITGDEKVKVKKEKKTLPVNVLIVFFAVSIIILGICMISGSVYAKDKINEVVEANAKPQVDITRNDDNNTIEINVKHVRGITKIAYKWNDEDEVKWYVFFNKALDRYQYSYDTYDFRLNEIYFDSEETVRKVCDKLNENL